MSRIASKNANPMLTAEQVRRRFGEPEPKKHRSRQYYVDAMVKLEKAIRRTKTSDQGTRSFSFDDLPYDVKQEIVEMVESSPGWVHLIFEKGQLVGFDGGNQEIYVNKEWYKFPVLRQTSNRREQFNQLKENVLGMNPLKCAGSLVHRSSTPKDEDKTLTPLKMSSDWVFFDGKASMNFQDPSGALPYTIAEVRTAVFKIDEIFDCIKRTDGGEEGRDFVLAKGSRVEDLVILLREFRKEVPPEKLTVIRAFRVENVDKEIDKTGDSCPGGADYSQSEDYMMKQITKAWSKTIVKRRERQHAWLESPEGWQWLSYPFHDESNTISKWLATEEGYKWLNARGSEFLASESGWWWLASDFGYPWLETPQGLEWLDTQGIWFLNSPQALLWANTGTSNGKVQKAWFEKATERSWVAKHCPNGDPPKPPQKPTGRPPRNSFVDQSFNNINFRGWKFVKCPTRDTV